MTNPGSKVFVEMARELLEAGIEIPAPLGSIDEVEELRNEFSDSATLQLTESCFGGDETRDDAGGDGSDGETADEKPPVAWKPVYEVGGMSPVGWTTVNERTTPILSAMWTTATEYPTPSPKWDGGSIVTPRTTEGVLQPSEVVASVTTRETVPSSKNVDDKLKELESVIKTVQGMVREVSEDEREAEERIRLRYKAAKRAAKGARRRLFGEQESVGPMIELEG